MENRMHNSEGRPMTISIILHDYAVIVCNRITFQANGVLVAWVDGTISARIETHKIAYINALE